MNKDKLSKLQEQVRIGGKGSARRKKKVVHRTATTDDKKLQGSLKKLSTNNIPGIEEVNMIKDDGTVIHFNNPKVQASLAANTFAITGHGENKQIIDLIPGILNQLGPDGLSHLKKLTNVGGMGGAGGMGGFGAALGAGGLGSGSAADIDDDDEVPDLVGNFDDASKEETVVAEKAAEANAEAVVAATPAENGDDKPKEVVADAVAVVDATKTDSAPVDSTDAVTAEKPAADGDKATEKPSSPEPIAAVEAAPAPAVAAAAETVPAAAAVAEGEKKEEKKPDEPVKAEE